MRRFLVLLTTTAAALAPVALAQPARAADVPGLLPGVTQVGDLVTGGGRILLSAGDKVLVADRLGVVTGEVTGLAGAAGLAVTPDGSRAYVALATETGQVAEIDPVRRRVLRRIAVPAAYPCPSSLALTGTRLWIGFGCSQGSDGGVLRADLSASRPAPTVVLERSTGESALAVAGSTLAFGPLGISPAYVEVFGIAANGTATRRGSVPADSINAANLQDLALSPDGRRLVTAFGYPYQHQVWNTTTLAEVRRIGPGQYPSAVAYSRNGSQLVTSQQYGPDVTVFTATTGAPGREDSTDGDVVPGTLAFLDAAGGDVAAVLRSQPGGPHYLWVSRAQARPAPTLTVSQSGTPTAGGPVTLTGRLTLAGGADPGRQWLGVARIGADGTPTALPPVRTGAAGRFTITDTPPTAGDLTYTVTWAGSATARGITTTAGVYVPRRETTLTLAGPATGAAGAEVRLTGTIRIGGAVPSGPVTVSAYKTVTNTFGSGFLWVADVTSTDGTFEVVDTPLEGGAIRYEVRTPQTDTAEAARAEHEVAVSSRNARIWSQVQYPAYAGQPYTVSGQVSWEVGDCAGPLTLHVSRQVDGGAVQPLPDLTTDATCTFSLTDSRSTPAEVHYTVRWDGDAGHDAVSGDAYGSVVVPEGR